MITHSKGATTFTGNSVEYFRFCTLKSAVGLELKGLKVRRGPVIWKQVKAEFHLVGNKEAVYKWLCNKVDELAPQQEHETRE